MDADRFENIEGQLMAAMRGLILQRGAPTAAMKAVTHQIEQVLAGLFPIPEATDAILDGVADAKDRILPSPGDMQGSGL